MANDTKAAPTEKPDPLGPRVPVKNIWFDRERDLPGGSYSSSLTGGGGPRNQKRWWIDFLPRVAMFEIRFSEASKDEVSIRYISSAWGSFEPL